MRLPVRRRSRGATMVESAVVLSTTCLMLFGLIVGAFGIMRYQQIASLAREATRAASVRGGQYRQTAGLAAGTTADWSNDIYSSGVARLPSNVLINVEEVGLKPDNLTYTCSWSNDDNWPNRVTSDNGEAVSNTVTVTVSYVWVPEMFFSGVTFTSTSQMTITN